MCNEFWEFPESDLVLSLISPPLPISLSLSSSLCPPPGEQSWVLSCWWSWPSRHETFSSHWRKWDRPLLPRQTDCLSVHLVTFSVVSPQVPCLLSCFHLQPTVNLVALDMTTVKYYWTCVPVIFTPIPTSLNFLFFLSFLLTKTAWPVLGIITKLLKLSHTKRKFSFLDANPCRCSDCWCRNSDLLRHSLLTQ